MFVPLSESAKPIFVPVEEDEAKVEEDKAKVEEDEANDFGFAVPTQAAGPALETPTPTFMEGIAEEVDLIHGEDAIVEVMSDTTTTAAPEGPVSEVIEDETDSRGASLSQPAATPTDLESAIKKQMSLQIPPYTASIASQSSNLPPPLPPLPPEKATTGTPPSSTPKPTSGLTTPQPPPLPSSKPIAPKSSNSPPPLPPKKATTETPPKSTSDLTTPQSSPLPAFVKVRAPAPSLPTYKPSRGIIPAYENRRRAASIGQPLAQTVASPNPNLTLPPKVPPFPSRPVFTPKEPPPIPGFIIKGDPTPVAEVLEKLRDSTVVPKTQLELSLCAHIPVVFSESQLDAYTRPLSEPQGPRLLSARQIRAVMKPLSSPQTPSPSVSLSQKGPSRLAPDQLKVASAPQPAASTPKPGVHDLRSILRPAALRRSTLSAPSSVSSGPAFKEVSPEAKAKAEAAAKAEGAREKISSGINRVFKGGEDLKIYLRSSPDKADNADKELKIGALLFQIASIETHTGKLAELNKCKEALLWTRNFVTPMTKETENSGRQLIKELASQNKFGNENMGNLYKVLANHIEYKITHSANA